MSVRRSVLTPRELDCVIALIMTGTMVGSAELLGIGRQTVKNHIALARGTLGVNSTAQLVYVLTTGDYDLTKLKEQLTTRLR